MESIISTFHIDWKIIVAQAVNFAIVFVVLYIFALKPLTKLMAERAEKIGKGLTDAKSNAAILEKTQKESDEILAKARKEAQKISQATKKDLEVKKSAMMEEAKSEAQAIIANGRKTLEMDKIKMLEEFKKEAIAVAMKASEKILASKSDLNNL